MYSVNVNISVYNIFDKLSYRQLKKKNYKIEAFLSESNVNIYIHYNMIPRIFQKNVCI